MTWFMPKFITWLNVNLSSWEQGVGGSEAEVYYTACDYNQVWGAGFTMQVRPRKTYWNYLNKEFCLRSLDLSD